MNIVEQFSFCFLLACLYLPDCSVAQDDDDNYQGKSQLQQVLDVWNAILHLTQQRLKTANHTHVPANQESKAVQPITEHSVTLQNTSETASLNTINGKSMADKHAVSDNKQITDGGSIPKTNQVNINSISSTDPKSADQSVQPKRLLYNENDSMDANFRFEDLSQKRSRIAVNKTKENVSNVTDQSVVDTTMKLTKDSSSNNQYSANSIQPLRFGARSDKETKDENNANKILLPTDNLTATDNRNLQPIELDKQGASITKEFSWIGMKETGNGKGNEKKADINASSRDITPMISKEQTSEIPTVNMANQNITSVIVNTVENNRLNWENMHNSQTVTAKTLVDTGSIKSQESFSAKADTQSASQAVLPTDKDSFYKGHVNNDTQVTYSVFKAYKDMKNMQSIDTVHVINQPIVSGNNPSNSVITRHTSTLQEPSNLNAVYVKVSENLVKERGFVTDNPQAAVGNNGTSMAQHDQNIYSLVQSDVSQTNKVDIIAGNTIGDADTSSGIIDISPAAEIIESSIHLSAPLPPPTLVDQPIRTNDPRELITDKITNLQIHTNKRNESLTDGNSFSHGVVVVPELKSENTESNKVAGFVHITMTTDPLQNFGTYQQPTGKSEKPDTKVTSNLNLFTPGYDTKEHFVNTNSSQLASNGSIKTPFASLIQINGKFSPDNVFSGGKSHKEAVKDVLNEKPSQINDTGTISSNNETYTNILEKTRMEDSKQTGRKNVKKWTPTFRNSKTEGGNRKQTFSFMSKPPAVKMLSSENVQSPDNTATATNTPETEYKVALQAPVIPYAPTKTDSLDKKQSNGMTQSITNFENNRLLYNEFRKFKMYGKYRRKRSILSAPAFMYQLMDKPVKVFSSFFDTVLEHPENSHKKTPASLKLNFRTDKENDLTNSKIHQGHVSIKIVNELPKTDKVSKNKKNKALNRHEEKLHLHEVKPLRHKKRKYHKKRDTNDKILLVNRISKTLSNGLPVFSTRQNKLKGTQEKTIVVSDKYNNKQKGIEISSKTKSLQQQISDVGELYSYTTDVHKNADSKFENTFSNHQGSLFKQKTTHVDALMEEPVSQSETHPGPDKNHNVISSNMDQILDLSYSNLNYVEQNLIDKHDLVSTPSINTDSSRSSQDILDNGLSSTASTPLNVSSSDIEANVSTQKIPFQLSDDHTTGLSSVTSHKPQTVVNMSNLVSGLSINNDLVITNDTPSYYNTLPIAVSPRFQSNSKNEFIDQFEKTLTSDVSNVKTSMVAGGCIIDGNYYRFEDMPSSIQGCHEAQTKPDYLKLSISETKPVPNDYTDNRGFISQGFVTKFPVLEVIRGNDARPFAIKLPGDMQGYDIIVDPHLNDGSIDLAVLHANNQKANDLVVSEKNSGDSVAELNLKQDFGTYGDIDNNYVFKWSDGISDKAGTGLASLPDYNLGSEVRVGSSLSMGHTLFLDKEPNDIKNTDSIGYDLAFQNGGTIDLLDLQSHKTKGHNYVYQSLLNRIPSPIFVSSKEDENQSNTVKIDSKITPESMVATPSPGNLSQNDGNKHLIDIAENNVGELSYHQPLTENNVNNNHIYSNYNGVYLARNDDLLHEKMRNKYQPSYTPNTYKSLSELLKDPTKGSVIQPSQLKGSFISKMNLEAEMPKDFSGLKLNLIGDSFSNSLIAKQRRSSGMIPTSIPMKHSGHNYELTPVVFT